MKKCLLVMTDSDLVSKLYDDDEITGKYANPALVAANIDNNSFLGWTVQLTEIPTVGDCISLSNVREYLFLQWIEKVDDKDSALCYFLNMIRQEPIFGNYSCDSSGESLDDPEIIVRILNGTGYKDPEQWKHNEGLIDGIMVVDKRIFVPGCDTVVLSVKHSL